MDLDGTLTQHRSPLSSEHREMLTRLSRRYRLLMVGAGQVMRIFNQMEGFPLDIIGNYGLQYGIYDEKEQGMRLVKNEVLPCDRETVSGAITFLRERFGFTEFRGESVEFHPSGCITFPILGTKADLADKLSFDPDRSRRRAIYDEVVKAFPDYHVFVGGSSSFDMSPRPYNKYYALDIFCRENGYTHDQILYFGDDYGTGGNDESVAVSDFSFIPVDDYRDFLRLAEKLLEEKQ